MVRKINSKNEKLTYVFDLDGVIYRGKTPQPYAVESLNKLSDLGHDIYYFTNNAALTRRLYVEKLDAMGITTKEDYVMTSSYATALYLKENYDVIGKKVLVVGHEGIIDELTRIGMVPCVNDDLEEYDFVVAGIARNITYNKIWAAMYAIRNGAVFIATNTDKTYPLEQDMLAPGGGAIVAAIVAATDTEPYVCGKPNIFALKEIMKMAGSSLDNTIMVGDRLDTDMEVANNAGVVSTIVMHGVTSFENAKAAVGIQKPEFIIEDLRELLP